MRIIKTIKHSFTPHCLPVRFGRTSHIYWYLVLFVATLLGAGKEALAQTSFNPVETNPFSLTATQSNYSSPAFADLDNDGDLDVLACSVFGTIDYYQNTGTATDPSFATSVTNPFSLTSTQFGGSPVFVDLDRDDDLDLMVGDQNGNFSYYQNTGTVSSPTFSAAVLNPFSLTDIGLNAQLTFGDLDNDGDLDLLSAERNDGLFHYFENIGTSTSPSFDVVTTNPFSLTIPINTTYLQPVLVDLDGDLDLDLMTGDRYSFKYYENTGTLTAPVFGSPITNPYSLTYEEQWITPTFGDLDGDGDLDILNGSFSGNLYYFENQELPVTIVWDGETSTDWNVATNWNGDVLPTPVNPVQVPFISGKLAKYPVVNTDIEVRNLEIATDASLSISSNSLTVDREMVLDGIITVDSEASLLLIGNLSGTGDATIHRNTTYGISDGQYSIIGSPIASGTTDDLGAVVYSYDETISYGTNGNARFSLVTTPTSMTAGDAYFSANTENLFFVGMPNSGNVTGSLVYDETNDGGSTNAGFNLVSNPYTAAISYTDLMTENSNLNGTLYLWDDGGSDMGQRTNSDYITVTSMGATGGSSRSGDWDGYIRSAQGFFVKATAAGTVTFSPSMMKTTNNTDGGYFRKHESAQPLVRLALSSETGTSDVLIGFSKNATNGFDRMLDAYKVKGNSDLQLYSRMNDEILSIQALPHLTDEMTIDLGYDVAEAGRYTFELSEISLDGFKLYLVDHEVQNTVELSETSNYSFETGTVTDSDRFSLTFTPNVVMNTHEEFSHENLQIYSYENQLHLQVSSEVKKADVSIYDLSGALIQHADHVSFKDGNWSAAFPYEGLFILTVQTENQLWTNRFFK